MNNVKKISFCDFGDIDKTIFITIIERYKKEFNTKVVLDDINPDYLIYSVFGDSHLEKTGKCIKIFYTGENIRPDFNLCDYAIGFDFMNFGDRYIRFPFYYLTQNSKYLSSESRETNQFVTKESFCSFVVSNNANADKCRENLFYLLSKYKTVNSGGRYLNNIGAPVDDKFAFEKRHKFSICCENASFPGYTTEKIVDAFAAGTIPIYYGDPLIGKVFNTRTFVHVKDPENLDAIVDIIKEIDNNELLYQDMLSLPILNDMEYSASVQIDKLYHFFVNIFEQRIDDAKRISTLSYARTYINKQKKWYRDHMKLNKVRKIKKKIMKVFL